MTARAVSAAAFALAAGVLAMPAPRASTTDDVQLAKLEAALAADPDNLRAGNDYRMSIIEGGQYDRALAFFKMLVTEHPDAANAHLNCGFAYVDKMPVAGAITQVILANNALNEFTRSLELRPSWLRYYTRGNSYLFWPRIFSRTHLGVADLEEAMKIQRADVKRTYHVRAYVALGDGYWKMGDAVRATTIWKEGLAQFPDNTALRMRLSLNGDERQALIDVAYDHTRRVDTRLDELWTSE